MFAQRLAADLYGVFGNRNGCRQFFSVYETGDRRRAFADARHLSRTAVYDRNVRVGAAERMRTRAFADLGSRNQRQLPDRAGGDIERSFIERLGIFLRADHFASEFFAVHRRLDGRFACRNRRDQSAFRNGRNGGIRARIDDRLYGTTLFVEHGELFGLTRF